MKYCVKFSLIFFAAAKIRKIREKCVIKIREIFNFLPLIIQSVTIGLSFLLLSVLAIISLYSSIFS